MRRGHTHTHTHTHQTWCYNESEWHLVLPVLMAHVGGRCQEPASVLPSSGSGRNRNQTRACSSCIRYRREMFRGEAGSLPLHLDISRLQAGPLRLDRISQEGLALLETLLAAISHFSNQTSHLPSPSRRENLPRQVLSSPVQSKSSLFPTSWHAVAKLHGSPPSGTRAGFPGSSGARSDVASWRSSGAPRQTRVGKSLRSVSCILASSLMRPTTWVDGPRNSSRLSMATREGARLLARLKNYPHHGGDPWRRSFACRTGSDLLISGLTQYRQSPSFNCRFHLGFHLSLVRPDQTIIADTKAFWSPIDIHARLPGIPIRNSRSQGRIFQAPPAKGACFRTREHDHCCGASGVPWLHQQHDTRPALPSHYHPATLQMLWTTTSPMMIPTSFFFR